MLDKIKKIDKKYFWILAAVVLSLMIMFYFRHNFVGSVQMDFNGGSENTEAIPLSGGNVRQYFTISKDIKYMDVLMQNEGENTEKVAVSLYNSQTGELLQQQEVQVAPLDGGEQQIHLEMETQGLANGTELYIEFTSDENNQNVFLCANQGEYEEVLLQNTEEKDLRLRMDVTYGWVKYKMFFALTGIVVLVACFILLVPVKKKKQYNIQNMFLILALTGGVAMAVINPPAQECDGWEHLIRAVDVSYGNVLRPFADVTHEDGVIRVPENINDFSFQIVRKNSGSGTPYIENLKSQSFSDNSILMPYTGGVTSISYWPQALGLFIGRTLGVSMYTCVLLARLFNLAVYIALTYFAIKRMPVYKELFTIVALMPLTIYQAASGSPDSLMNALCFLFIALCFHYALEEEKKLNWKHAISLSVILLFIFVIKYVYVCIGLLVFLIPMKRFGGKKEYWKSFGIAMIPLVLAGGYLLVHMFQSVQVLQATDGGMTQTQYLMENPIALIKVLCSTVINMFYRAMENLNMLGWLEYPLESLIHIVPCFVTAVACINVDEKTKRLTKVQKLLSTVTGALCIVAVLVGLYIGDGRNNPVGAAVVNGFQGRYLIPVLALLFIGMGSRKIENHMERFTEKTVGAMGLMMAYAVIQVAGYCY